MKYYLIAGEASGDLHGSNLMKGLRRYDPRAEFRFWGGDKMASVGGSANLVKHYARTSFFGFTEVLMHARTILGQIRECKRDVRDYAPDVLILIDYPGFNFRIAEYAHGKGIRTFYYISPKVWAWKEGRVELIRKYVDRLFIIFPFEREYFGRRGIDAIYEGNPLVDSVSGQMAGMPPREQFLSENGLVTGKPLVALLSGSRASEIKHNLPFMVSLSRRFPECRFVVAGVPWLDAGLYDHYLAGSDVGIVYDKTCGLVACADAAVVTSGTATLETALIGTPEMVCYDANRLSLWIARRVVKIRFISLVNLIMGREVVRELIGRRMTMERASKELSAILPGGAGRQKMLDDYAALSAAVGTAGASDRFARRMVEILKGKK